MTIERDLSASLPPLPPPRPDRRETAIDAAMRRFDGEAPAPPTPVPARGWRLLGRPQLGALAAAALAVTVGLPLWLSGELNSPVPTRNESVSPGAQPSVAAPIDLPTEPAAPSPTDKAAVPNAPAALRPMSPVAPAEDARDTVSETIAPPPPATVADMPMAVVAAPPPPPPPPPAPAMAAAERVTAADEVVVTGSRVSRSAAKLDKRVERREAPRGMAAANVEGAAVPRGRAVEPLPKNAAAWLNRGLAHAATGDDVRALADLDRAVRYAPTDARMFYQRSLILRRLGKIARADADRARATELDMRYAGERK